VVKYGFVHTCPAGAELDDEPVGDGDTLVLVGDGAGLVFVGDGAGLVVVGEDDGLVVVGEGDGLQVGLCGLQPGEAACASCPCVVSARTSDATPAAADRARR
jgi:hypothetical protein